MAEKFIVVQGALCMCNFGTAPDKLKVLSNQKEYVNDKDGSKKLIATDKDIGMTMEKNMFGSCSKMNNKPCTATVTQWKNFYEDAVLSNGGKILLEDSKATCPIGGPDCIKVLFHGQVMEPSAQNFENSPKEVQSAINPLTGPAEETKESEAEGFTGAATNN